MDKEKDTTVRFDTSDEKTKEMAYKGRKESMEAGIEMMKEAKSFMLFHIDEGGKNGTVISSISGDDVPAMVRMSVEMADRMTWEVLRSKDTAAIMGLMSAWAKAAKAKQKYADTINKGEVEG